MSQAIMAELMSIEGELGRAETALRQQEQNDRRGGAQIIWGLLLIMVGALSAFIFYFWFGVAAGVVGLILLLAGWGTTGEARREVKRITEQLESLRQKRTDLQAKLE